MNRIVRLTESDLARIVKRVINEGQPTKIPSSASFGAELKGEQTPWLSITAMVGGTANNLSGYADVIEFDARLRYVKTYGGADKQNAGKVMNVKAYFGCKTNKFTAKNPSDGTTQRFGGQNMSNLTTSDFVDWALTSGLCPKGSYTSQGDLANAYRN
jgi:hypothetical protein